MRHLYRLTLLIVALALVQPASVGTQTTARKKLLFLTHAGLYTHTSLGPAEKAVTEWGKTGGLGSRLSQRIHPGAL